MRVALIGLALLAFLALSAAITRVLSAQSAERRAVVDLVRAQARGDAREMLDRLAGCRASSTCRATVAANVARLRRRGKVEVLRYDAPSGISPSGRTVTARIAWRAGDALPVVQCARVRRAGDVVRGFDVRVEALSRSIAREGSC